MALNISKSIAIASSVFLLSGCTNVATHAPETTGIPQTPSLPKDLPPDAATHDPAAQHTLIKRGLYLDDRGEIRSLADEKPVTEPEPAPPTATRPEEKAAPPERRFAPVVLPIPGTQHD